MRTLRLTLAYEGTLFAGWQVQPDRRTVQGDLEACLSRLTDRAVRIAGSGRTDTGVHARGQVASLISDTLLDEETILRGANALLPSDVRVLDVREASPDFHARRSARGKEYRYQIDQGPVLSPFRRRFAWHLRRPLDDREMNEAAARLVGTHDFSSFVSAGGQAEHHRRTVTEARFLREGEEGIVFRIRADGFLYRMVRNVVGSLVEVGRGRVSAADLTGILAARDRRRAGPTAPAHGLFLHRVDYPEPAGSGG